jgi:hypothetical protein
MHKIETRMQGRYSGIIVDKSRVPHMRWVLTLSKALNCGGLCRGARWCPLCVPKTLSVLISRRNRLMSAHHNRADMFRPES